MSKHADADAKLHTTKPKRQRLDKQPVIPMSAGLPPTGDNANNQYR